MDDDIGESTTPIPSDSIFAVRDVVLAFHGHLLYEARVLTVHYVDDAPHNEDEVEDVRQVRAYTVHFQGWKKSWDETVLKHMVYEHNDENLRIAHRLLNGARLRQQAQSQAVSTATTATNQQHQQPQDHEEEEPHEMTNGIDKSPEHATNNGSATNHDDDALPDTPTTATTNSIDHLFNLTATLQRMLVDDWEYITKDQKLVSLPREPTVAQILNKWLNTKKNGVDETAKEVADALIEYFDSTLPKTLLYHFERRQYTEFFVPGKKSDPPEFEKQLRPSNVYGAEHLLRLIHKLPFMLECSTAARDTMQVIADKVNDLTKYIQRNIRFFFQLSYTPAPKSYLKALGI